MPARFKATLKDNYPADDGQVAVGLWLDSNLQVMPYSVYEVIAKEYEVLPELDPEARHLKQIVTGLVSIEKIDSAGRIRVDSSLREIAQIDRDVTLVGRMDKFEIWDRARWLENQAEVLQDYSNLTQRLSKRYGPGKEA